MEVSRPVIEMSCRRGKSDYENNSTYIAISGGRVEESDLRVQQDPKRDAER